MARTYFRFLVVIVLAVAFEQVRLALHANLPGLGHGSIAFAQPLADPWADPSGVRSIPPGAMPNNFGTNPAIRNNNLGPSAPTQPTSPTRPGSWPGGNQAQGTTQAPPMATGAYRPINQPPGTMAVNGPPAAPKKPPTDPPYDPATIVARVGSEVVQANEVLPNVHKYMQAVLKEHADALGQLPPEVRQEQLQKVEREGMKRSIAESIRIKLLLAEIRGKIPAEGITKNEENMRKGFNDGGIKRLMTQYNATSYIDLENKLREQGSSIEAQRLVFIEQNLAIGWLRQQVKNEPEPTHEEMLAYYHEHQADWETPARARWEHLMVKFLNFDSKTAAQQTIARWGNEIMRGAPFAAVAKAHSQDFSSTDGGLKDWTTKGSLRSETLDQAVFTLPVGVLSQIIADEDGLHIVRVLEREEAKRDPFNEVQEKIKKQLYDGNKEKHMNAYVEKLRERVPVWTMFDEPPAALATQPGAGVTR